MAGRNQPSDRCNNVDVRSSSLFSSLETCVQELFEVFNVDKTNDEPVSLCLNGMISISFEYHMSAISQSNEADEDLVSVGISLVNVLRMVLNRYTNVISLSSPSSTTYQNHLMKFVVIFAILQRHMNPTQADQTITTLYLVPAFPVLALRSIINIPMSVTEIETVVPFICDIIIKWFENNSSELKSPEKLMTSVVTHWFDVIRDHKDNQLIFNTLLKVLESVFNIVNAEITEIQKWFGNSEFTDGAIVFVFEIILPKLIESNDFFTLWFILTSLILPIISNHSTTMKLFHSRLSPQVFVWWLTSLKCEGRSSSVQHITQCLSLLDSYSVPSVRKEAISKVPSIFVLLIELMNVHGRTSAIIAPVSEVLWKLCLHVPNQNLCGQCPDCFSVFIQTMQYYISDVNELENERTLEKLTLALWTICGHYNNQIAMNSFSVHFSSFIDALQVCRDKPKALSYLLGLIGSLSDFNNNQLVFIEIPQSVEIIAEMFLCNVDNTMVIKQACRALTGLANEKSDVASRLANVNGFGEALVDLFNASVTKLDMIKGIGKLLVAVSGGDTNLTGSYWHMLIRSRVKDIEICLKLKTDGLEFDSILCSLVLIVFHDNQQLKETFQACSDAPLQVFMNMMSDFGGYSQYTELLVQIFEEFVTPDLWNIYPPGKRRWFISALIEMLKLVSDMEEENQTERIARLLCERSSFHDTRNEVWVDSFVANVWHIVFQAMTTFSSDVTIITHLIQFCHSMVTLSTKVKGTDRVIFTMLQVVPDMAAQLFNLLLVHFESNQCAKLQGLLVRELQYVVLSSGSMGESFVIEFFDNNQNNLELLIQLIPRFPIGLGDMNNILPDSLFQFLGYIIKISHRCFAYLVSSVSLMDNVVNYIQTLPTALLEVSRLDSSYKLVESLAKDQGFANRFIDRDQMVPTLMTLLDKYCGLKDQGRLLQEFLECVDTLCQHEAVMVKLCISSLLLPKLLNIIESILTSSKGYDQANSEKIKLITYPMIIRYIAYVKSHNRLNEFRVQYGTVLDAVVSVMVGSNYYDELSLGLISMSLEYNLPLQLQFLTVNNQREKLLKNFDTAISESKWNMIDLHWRVFSILQLNYPQESIPLVSHPVYKRGFEVTLLLLKTNDKYIDHFLVHRLLQHTSHVAILITASVNFCPILFDILKKSRNNKSRLMNVLQKIVHVVKCPDCHKQLLTIKGFCTILIELMRDFSHDSDVLRMLGPIITNLSKYKKGASVLMANKDFPKVLSDTVVSQGADASNVIASVLLGLLGMFRSNLEYAKVFQDDAKFLNVILECLMKEDVQECVTVFGTLLEFFIVLGGKFVKNIKIQFSVTKLLHILCKQKRNMIVCRALLRILTKDQVVGELQTCCQSLVEILIEFSAELTIATILSEWFLCWMTTIPNHRSLFPIANDYLQLLDVLEMHYHDSASNRDIVKGLRVEYFQQETVSLGQYTRLLCNSRSVEMFSNPTIVDSFAIELIQVISKYIEANDYDCITSVLSDLLDGIQFPLFCSILYEKLFKRDRFNIFRWVISNFNYSFNLTYASVKLFNACMIEGMTKNDIQQSDFASVCIVLMPQIIQYTEQLVVTHACVDQLILDTMTVMIELVMRIGQLLDHDINCQYRFSYMLIVNNLEPWLNKFNTDQCDHVISGMLSLIGLVVNSTKATAYDKESVEWLMNTLVPLYQTCITIRLSIMQHISFIYDCCETISDKQLLNYYEFLISSINEYRCDENEEIRKKVILWACKSLTSVSACLIKCESIDKTKLIAILLDAFSFVKAFSLDDNFTMCETLATYVSGINVTQLKAENVRVESVRHCIHRIVNCLSVSMEDATTVIAFLTNILLMLSHLLDMLHDATVEDIESIIVVLTHHYSCDIFLVSDRFVHGVLLVLKSTIHRIQFNGPMISSIHVSAILQLFSKLCQFSTITLHETLFIHSLIVQVIPYLPFSINESELETLQALFHCMLDAVQSVELDSHFVEILSNLAFVGIELRCRGISTIDSAINHVINRAVMLLDTNTAVNDMELLQTIRTISNDDPAGMKVELNDDSMSLLLSLLKSRWKEQLLVLLILNFIECTSWHTSTTSLLEILLSLLINYKHSCEAVEILCRIIDNIARDVESFDQLAGVATTVFGCTDKVLLLLVEQCQRNQSKAASLHAIVTLMNFLVQHPMEMEFTFEALERCRTEARRLSGLCNTDSNLANMLLDIAGHTPTKDSTTESAELSLSSTITSIPCADLSISALLDMNVYKGVWRRSTLVAIKIIRSKPSIAVATIKKEVEILQSLRHPRVVSLLGVCSGLSLTLEHAKSDIDSTYHGLVLEFMSKGTLRNVLNTEFSIMSLNNKLQYIVDICDGLLFLHESNVYHGLLTSETVLIDSHDRAKLTGLGKQDYRKYTTNNTPESLSIVDQKNDVWSFGMIMWEIITGKKLPTGDGNSKKASKLGVFKDEITNCPSVLFSIMTQCIDTNINSRPFIKDIVETVRQLHIHECNQRSEKSRVIPDGFICPITQDIMRDPVMLMDGHSYERKAIEDWLTRSSRSPLTNEILQDRTTMFDNYALKSSIESFLKHSSEFVEMTTKKI